MTKRSVGSPGAQGAGGKGAGAGGAGAQIGRRLGSWLSSTWGSDLEGMLRTGRHMSGALARALLDHFVANKLAASIWPPLATLALLLAIPALAPGETRKALIGLVILFAIGWSVFGTIAGSIAAWPHVRLWLVTRLGPVHHTRLVLFSIIRSYHEAFLAGTKGDGFIGEIIEASIAAVQKERNLSATRVAFAFADHLAPILVRHLCLRLVLIVAPVVAALLYYRFYIYPNVIQHGTHLRPWSIALYPIALAIDFVAGTHLRAALP
jgi:hypothetical protein